MYAADVEFLRQALHEVFTTPEAPPRTEGHTEAGGVAWREYPQSSIVEFTPRKDLRQRLEVLPQSYLAADRSLATLGRGQVFAVRGRVDQPMVLVRGTLTNQCGQVVASAAVTVMSPMPDQPSFAIATPHPNVGAAVARLGFDAGVHNPGPVDVTSLQPLIPAAVKSAADEIAHHVGAAREAVTERVRTWTERTRRWQEQADELVQRQDAKVRRTGVRGEAELVAEMAPSRTLVRPLLLVVPWTPRWRDPCRHRSAPASELDREPRP